MIDIHVLGANLRLGEDGIWYSSGTQNISYPLGGNDAYFAVEDASFWFKHRNDCITSVVRRFPPEDNEAIFDIGGGNGFVSLGLANAGFEVVLMEPGVSGASNAKKRGLKNVICATTDTAKISRESLSAVGLFDVIEHIEDDLSFLQSIRDLMKPGGYLYATVPAYSFLWSAEDVLAGHFRRYDLKKICSVLTAAGFTIKFSSYFFRLLPIPIFLFRALPYRLGLSRLGNAPKDSSRDHLVNGEWRKSLLSWKLDKEVENLTNKQPMRFGGSCLIVAKAPKRAAA